MPVEGRDLSSRQTQYVVKDLEIGKPINSEECSKNCRRRCTRKRRREVLSESRMREICLSGSVHSDPVGDAAWLCTGRAAWRRLGADDRAQPRAGKEPAA